MAAQLAPPPPDAARLLSLLAARDAREKALDRLVGDGRSLTQKALRQADHVRQLEAALTRLRADAAADAAAPPPSPPAPALQKRVRELEAQVAALKDERAELYKTLGQNAQRLLDVNDTLKLKDEAERAAAAENQRLAAAAEKLARKAEALSQNLAQKDVTIQMLHDELSTLQLELNKTDERIRALQKENTSLLQRWLKKKNEEADKMNEANQFYESVVETSIRAAERDIAS